MHADALCKKLPIFVERQMNVWKKQPDFTDPTWYLEFDAGFYVVAKSAGGDWYAGWNPEADPCIADDTFEYFDTWQQARAYCEALINHRVTT